MGKIGMPGGGGGGADTSIVTATAGDVLSGKVIVDKDGNPLTGSMANNGAVSPSALGAGGSYTIPAGYHNGSGIVTVKSLVDMTADAVLDPQFLLTGYSGYDDGVLKRGTMTVNYAGSQAVSSGKNDLGVYYYINKGYYDPDASGTVSWVYRPLSDFGAVPANKVVSGQTFTSTAGLKVTGTMAVTSAINFKATALSATSIRISWTNPSQGPWEGVFIQMSTSGNPGVSGGSRVYTGRGTNGTVGGASNYVDITGLTLATTYYFTCTSYVTGLGNGSSYNVSAKTKGVLIYDNGSGNAFKGISSNTRYTYIAGLVASTYLYNTQYTDAGFWPVWETTNAVSLSSINDYSNVKLNVASYNDNYNRSTKMRIEFAFYSGSTLKATARTDYTSISYSKSTVEVSIPLSSSVKTNFASYYSSYGNPKIRIGHFSSSFEDENSDGETVTRYAFPPLAIYKVSLQ